MNFTLLALALATTLFLGGCADEQQATAQKTAGGKRSQTTTASQVPTIARPIDQPGFRGESLNPGMRP